MTSQAATAPLPSTSISPERFVSAVLPTLRANAARHDLEGTFVADNYRLLAEHGAFALLVPTELGGGGLGYGALCDVLRQLAHGCGSTALALSMHSHLVAAAVWKYRHGKPGEAMLRKVAESGTVLMSTGAGDWLGSNGTLRRVEGGYRLTARKSFCSGSPAGGVFVTSSVYDDPSRGPRVLHFPVPRAADGVTLLDDWDTMSMRGTGSNTAVFEDVFIPEASIALDRPRAGWHPAWNVVLTVAAPIYTAPYVGVAETACAIAREAAQQRIGEHTALLLGEMETLLVTSQMALREMVANAEELAFVPSVAGANAALVRKTIASKAAIAAVDKAMEVVGGSSIARARGLERCFRDVRASPFHPLAEKPQASFTGRVSLGLDPV